MECISWKKMNMFFLVITRDIYPSFKRNKKLDRTVNQIF
jgi:hypothetical protein